MCGIAGIVSADQPDAALVRRMCDVLAHRGPDGAGYHEGPHAVLGMRRLAIIDVAGGQQPVYNEDRTVAAVFNGEIYNFAELRAGIAPTGSPDDDGWGQRMHPAPVRRIRGIAGRPPPGHVRPRRLGCRAAAPATGAGPGGQKAPVLALRRQVAVVRLGAQGARGRSRPRAPGRPGRPASLPHLSVRAGAVVHLSGGAQSCCRGTSSPGRTGGWRPAGTGRCPRHRPSGSPRFRRRRNDCGSYCSRRPGSG